jgi:hypothetical protein
MNWSIGLVIRYSFLKFTRFSEPVIPLFSTMYAPCCRPRPL